MSKKGKSAIFSVVNFSVKNDVQQNSKAPRNENWPNNTPRIRQNGEISKSIRSQKGEISNFSCIYGVKMGKSAIFSVVNFSVKNDVQQNSKAPRNENLPESIG